MKTTDEFNNKYKDYLEDGFYGLAINDEDVIAYLDEKFTKEIETNPNFKYSQIKTKFNWVCVYAESDLSSQYESDITSILREKGYLK
jgi:hypothetical protein